MGIPLNFTFTAGNDQLIEWGPLVTGPTQPPAPVPTYVNDATGTATLFDPNGVIVPGVNALPFNYVLASDGLYYAQVLGSSFNPPIGSGYILQVKLTSSTEGEGFWTVAANVIVRTD